VSRTVPILASAKHTLRPPIGQLTSARRLAASCTPALVARTTTVSSWEQKTKCVIECIVKCRVLD
jgi:hypothetical protein